MEKILYVLSSPAMSSYGAGFIKAVTRSMFVEPIVVIFLSHDDDRNKKEIFSSYNLEGVKPFNIYIFRYPKSKMLLYIFQYYNILSVKKIAEKMGVKRVHFLTQDTFLAFYLKMFKTNIVYYTVHDLEEHAAKLTFFGRLKKYLLLTMKDKWLIRRIDNLVTSSLHQFESLQNMFPCKNIYQHNMPSLVTASITLGNKKISELDSLNNYILFFGRIEAYKGIELLYRAFVETTELKNVHLVIAGKGNIYFDREYTSETNITFINRFIHDGEINNLFNKAQIVILPYTSATQSAVTSLSYHFLKPMIVSDIAGLNDTIIHEKTGLLFNPKNEIELRNKILNLLNDRTLYQQIIDNQLIARDSIYGIQKLTKQIEDIYKD